MLAAMLLVPLAHGQVKPTATGQRAFWCQDPSGREVMQLESCAPGKEVRPSELVGPRGVVVPKPPSSAVAPAAPRAAAAARPPAATGTAAVPAPAPESAASAPRRSAVKAGLFGAFKVLGVALLLGLVGYWRRQPFRRWAAVGGGLGLVLAVATW